jgi:hypothetical protein|tara:strand:- start:1254 stop:2174 length:921 start_codon:yes stop_codon:yes gene_type:complete
MAENEEQVPVVEQAPAAVVEPEVIGDDVFDDLYNQTFNPTPQEPEAPAEEPTPLPAAPVAEQPTGDTEALRREVDQLKGVLGQLAQHAQAQNAQAKNASQPAAPSSDNDMGNLLRREFPEADDQAIHRLNTVLTEASKMQVRQAVSPLTQQLAAVTAAVTQQQNEATKSQYTSELEDLAQQAGIDDAYERDLMLSAVASKGMQKHGNGFNMDHAKALFRELNNQRVRSRHQANNQYVQEKTQETNNTPPLQTGQSGGTATESIQNAIRDSNNPDMDFRGQGMENTVRRFLEAGDRAAQTVLGGQRK